MKQIIFFGVLLSFACGVNAKPYYSYDLYGTVTGEAAAANALANVDIGDEFLIRLDIGKNDAGEHLISFDGVIGGWTIFEQESNGYYHWGDWSPERFYTTGSLSPLAAPEGNGSVVTPYDIYLTLLGMEETGTVPIPEEKQLVRDTGELNLDQFRSGGFHFWFFNQLDGSSTGSEQDLYGSITRILKVPEPGTLVLSALGLGFFLIKRRQRHQR
ncbi:MULTISPECIES: PEP-CTERM sorting domain-containing protein [Marinobacter]|uniref:PEP-CTERM sorting domain-containing protein n=1 Tax=Marinobacter TaxID=2742 RepID=UPI001247E8F5|nr:MULTISPECIES: PEP-CTERM sorting domain-containing protein [Marinobacter]MBL3556723.1 PEP-CTERM sorting domain-containing protein [Marinobacter sp. JB05H06]